MSQFERRYERSGVLTASPQQIFEFADDPKNFSAHMNKRSWMMLGTKMDTIVDEREFKEVGSHMQMVGNIVGIKLYLDEVVTDRNPNEGKGWKTIPGKEKLKLVVVGDYAMAFRIEEIPEGSNFTVSIDYDLPKNPFNRALGYLMGDMYAHWCVNLMLDGVKQHFNKVPK